MHGLQTRTTNDRRATDIRLRTTRYDATLIYDCRRRSCSNGCGALSPFSAADRLECTDDFAYIASRHLPTSPLSSSSTDRYLRPRIEQNQRSVNTKLAGHPSGLETLGLWTTELQRQVLVNSGRREAMQRVYTCNNASCSPLFFLEIIIIFFIPLVVKIPRVKNKR